MTAAPPPLLARAHRAPSEQVALGALAAALRDLAAGAPLDETLDAIAAAAGEATGCELTLVRVADGDGDELAARTVRARSAVLAAEIAGSRLAAGQAGREARELTAGDDGGLPPGVRRAAARADAETVLLVPVLEKDAAVATLELYRSAGPFSDAEKRLAELAAAEVAVALELARASVPGDVPGDRARVSLELVAEALAAGSDEAELADVVVRLAAEATGAARCVLWRIELDAPPAFLAAHDSDGGSPGAAVGAERVEQALAQRQAPGGVLRPDGDGAIVVPLGEPPAGALELVFPDGAAGDLEALAALAARAAVGLRRTRRAHLIALALRRSQTIVAVISQAIARLSLSHTLDTAVERISELTASAHVAIYLRDGERLTAAASRGLRGSHVALAERLLELALGPSRSRGFLFIADMRRDARLGGLDDVLAETGVRRALVVPLVVGDEVIGALAVFKQRPRTYRAGEEGLLIALSSQLAVAVQNARLHERTKELREVLERTLASERKAARQVRGLFRITHSFARSLSLEATLGAVATSMVELFGIDAAAILMPGERGDQLEPRAIHVADEALRPAASTILSRAQPIEADIVRRVLGAREPVVLTGSGRRVGGTEMLMPFLRKGSTAAVLPLATPAEVLGTLTLLSLDPTRPIDAETLETAETVSAQAALAIVNARLSQQQKDFAETMQRSLLPSDLPAVPGLEIGHVYESSARVDVGGDVYDFVPLEDGRLAVCLGDVAGKGIQAAADMAMAKYSVRALARTNPEPSALLACVNEVVVEEIALGKFVTMVYAVLDPRTGVVSCASAGHPPARLVGADGNVVEVEASGLALGVEPDQDYAEARSTVGPGTSLVLYTDGVTEARRDGELYGEGRLDAFLRRHAGLAPQELAEGLVADCRAFAGGDISDDCAVVVLRLAP